MIIIKNNTLNIILNTTGDFIKYLEIKSILKFGKVIPIITVKKLANAIKTIQKIPGN